MSSSLLCSNTCRTSLRRSTVTLPAGGLARQSVRVLQPLLKLVFPGTARVYLWIEGICSCQTLPDVKQHSQAGAAVSGSQMAYLAGQTMGKTVRKSFLFFPPLADALSFLAAGPEAACEIAYFDGDRHCRGAFLPSSSRRQTQMLIFLL